jgi:hypothetical protein
MALHHNVLVEHSFAAFFLQAILNRRTTIQGAVDSAAGAAAAAVDVVNEDNLNRHFILTDLPSLSIELAASLHKLKTFDNDQAIAHALRR